MNLTNQQLLQVFMLYPNAKILYDGHEWDLDGYNLKYHLKYIYLTRELNATEVRIDLCQLLLRSIDQLTEEEKRGLTEIIGTEHNSIDLDDGQLCWKYRGIFNGYIDLKELPYPAVDYLRSKNIALPFMGYDLFEEGVAKRIYYSLSCK